VASANAGRVPIRGSPETPERRFINAEPGKVAHHFGASCRTLNGYSHRIRHVAARALHARKEGGLRTERATAAGVLDLTLDSAEPEVASAWDTASASRWLLENSWRMFRTVLFTKDGEIRVNQSGSVALSAEEVRGPPRRK